jgi:hypothetical protein
MGLLDQRPKAYPQTFLIIQNCDQHIYAANVDHLLLCSQVAISQGSIFFFFFALCSRNISGNFLRDNCVFWIDMARRMVKTRKKADWEAVTR